MKFCVDIDGVLRDMLTPMIECYNKDFADSKTIEDIMDYDINISFPKITEYSNYDAFDYFFKHHSKEIIKDAKVICGAKDALDILHMNGDEVIIVSYQPSINAKIETLRWLNKNKIYYDKIVFTDTPSKKSISDHCDYIVDDKPEYLAESCAFQVCIDYPYNRGREWSGGRWKSIYEFVKRFILNEPPEGGFDLSDI